MVASLKIFNSATSVKILINNYNKSIIMVTHNAEQYIYVLPTFGKDIFVRSQK